MKNLAYLVTNIFLLFSCSQVNNNAGTENTSHASHGEVETNLTLNNGDKWKADSSTYNNVMDLKNTSDMFKIQPFPSLNEYHILGSDLTKGINKMIQECKMTGPDHEALHKWLEPILENANKLKSVSDPAAAKPIIQSIDARLDEYGNYFES